jgi:hypothetical protein
MTRPSIIDDASIGIRAREIRDAESAVRSGCNCADSNAYRDLKGDIVHRPDCVLGPGLPPAVPPIPRWPSIFIGIDLASGPDAAVVAIVGPKGFLRCLTPDEAAALAIPAAHRRAVADAIDGRETAR